MKVGDLIRFVGKLFYYLIVGLTAELVKLAVACALGTVVVVILAAVVVSVIWWTYNNTGGHVGYTVAAGAFSTLGSVVVSAILRAITRNALIDKPASRS